MELGVLHSDRKVGFWHIASFRCAAELGRYGGIADIEWDAPQSPIYEKLPPRAPCHGDVMRRLSEVTLLHRLPDALPVRNINITAPPFGCWERITCRNVISLA